MNSQDGDDLDEVQRESVKLSDEDRGYALEAGGSVHVNSGSDWQDEATDVFRHAVLLFHTLHHQGQRSRAKTKWLTMNFSSIIVLLFLFSLDIRKPSKTIKDINLLQFKKYIYKL